VFFRQVLHDDLGCASYVVASHGEAAVIDPKWDIADYLDLAEEHGFAIRHIFETHNHADHVSGHGRLAEATGATIHVSAEAGVDYAHEPLADGDVVAFGNVRITALATPGHRPEHMAFLVTDMGRGEESWLAVTGDSLFVGDLARPDLAVEPEEGAHALFGSLRRLLALDDFAEVWPGHIGGSLCGGAGMSQKPGSTIGFERRYNRLAKMEIEGDFVQALTSHLAAQPPNFKRVVELNRGPLLMEAAAIEPHAPARVKQLLDEGATLVDGRATREFDSAHVPGSINVTMTRSAVGTRAAWVVDPATDVVVTAASDAEALHLGRLLEAVGFRSIHGLLAGGVDAWRQAGLETAETPVIDPAGLAARIRAGDVAVLDVRDDDEWADGHVAGSTHVPYMRLGNGLPAELRTNGKPIAVACSTGNRSAIAVSLLARAGATDVIHVTDGGVAELAGEGIELVRGAG
jgi:glyoxylase-like metal-dependent hydrolase (beta-lactamase superfamily II)/rhodanese-related sulfurtransferase